MNSDTVLFDAMSEKNVTRVVIAHVYEALKEKGYDPETQITGYLLTGDPTYITNHRGARALVSKIDRYEFMNEVLRFYLKNSIGMSE